MIEAKEFPPLELTWCNQLQRTLLSMF
jgi:hypothetical protein